ncbi:hypothetical protein NFI96_000878, partial [Prochilodus magdalenae]
MAVQIVVLLTLMAVCLVTCQYWGFRVDCPPAVGVVRGTTEISCSFENSFTDQRIIIYGGRVTRSGETVFWFNSRGDQGDQGDPRFERASRYDPSLQITNTTVSDEGLYKYVVQTNHGIIQDGTFWISVTAKYSPPSTSTRPETIVDGGPAEFHCSASGGYPAGTIHWFDGTGSNWTDRATLEVTEGEDKLHRLSSKLFFMNINSDWGEFKCEVLNSRFITEGESTFRQAYRGTFEVHCGYSEGVIGQTTDIYCSFENRFPDKSIFIYAVTVTTREETVFWSNSQGFHGDPRFKLPSRYDPSLQITNTALSDEGWYDYKVQTDHGPVSGTFWISVT